MEREQQNTLEQLNTICMEQEGKLKGQAAEMENQEAKAEGLGAELMAAH